MAVNLFTGATNNNWGTATNWSQGTVPTASDGHVTTFDGTSPNCTVNTSNRVCNNIDFTGYTGTITMTFIITVSGNITYSSTMNVAGASAMQMNANGTITSNGFSWPNTFVWSATCTPTLSGNFTVTGSTTVNLNCTITLTPTTSEVFRTNGLSQSGLNSSLIGTAEVRVTGGTWVCSTSGGVGGNRIFGFDGNVTISGTCNFLSGFSGTAKWYSGTQSGGQININSSCTLDLAGNTFTNITFNTSGITLTVNSTLSATTLAFTSALAAITFAGTNGWTCATLSCPTVSAQTITLKESITYRVTTSASGYQSRVGSILLFTSSHESTKAILTLDNPASCNMLADFRRIDASNGRTIVTFNGTITDCTNIVESHDLSTSIG